MYDMHHSLRSCGMVNEEFFHGKNVHNYDYSQFENKYRTEIFNANKKITTRQTGYPIEFEDEKDSIML